MLPWRWPIELLHRAEPRASSATQLFPSPSLPGWLLQEHLQQQPQHEGHCSVPPCSSAQPSTHMQAGVVGEDPIVTQCHILLLPLLIEGLAAAFEENSLKERSHESQRVFVQAPHAPWRLVFEKKR